MRDAGGKQIELTCVMALYSFYASIERKLLLRGIHLDLELVYELNQGSLVRLATSSPTLRHTYVYTNQTRPSCEKR